MAYKRREVEAQLRNKFHFVDKPSRPHERIALFIDGRQVASTGFSRGLRKNADVDHTIMKLIAREIRVATIGNLRGMIDCDISYDDYLEILREGNYL